MAIEVESGAATGRPPTLRSSPGAHFAGHIEMTDDRRFNRRVLRLALTSAVALGLIWRLAEATPEAPAAARLGLLAGWLLMPLLLTLSLRRPLLRLALIIPSSLVGAGLLAISLYALATGPPAAPGWALLTSGVWFGGVLGAWFWFRLLPVPSGLAGPFSRGRLILIAAHVALTTLGILMVAVAVLR